MINANPYYGVGVAGTVQQIKADAGEIYVLKLRNTTGAAAYLQIFGKKAADVSLGTDTPQAVIPLGANEVVAIPMPVPLYIGPAGISVAGTTTATGSSGAAIDVFATVV